MGLTEQEQAGWPLIPGGQVRPSGSGEAGKLGPSTNNYLAVEPAVETGILTCCPGFLLVPWAMLRVHSFLSSEWTLTWLEQQCLSVFLRILSLQNLLYKKRIPWQICLGKC